MRALALFFPSFHPVLDGCERDEHPMIAPQMPAGGPIGQAVFHHQPDGQRDDPMRVMAAGRRQLRLGGAEVFPADRAIVLRVSEMQIARSSRNQIANIVQDPGKHPIPPSRSTTLWAGQVRVIPILRDALGSRQIFDPLEGYIGPVLARPQLLWRGRVLGSSHGRQVYPQSSVPSPLPR